MSDKSKQIAVITGDLVNSTALGGDKIERAMAALADCAEVQAEWHGESLRFTRHRGDGWQVVLAKPEMALRSALAFRAALRAEGVEFSSYIAIAKGSSSASTHSDLNDETGKVFIDSGATLEALKGYDGRFTLNVANVSSKESVFALADHISRDWTPAQAAAILPMLSPIKRPSYTDIAAAQGKSRQAITKSLDASGYTPLIYACQTYEGIHQND